MTNTNNINNETQQELYEIDINEGIGTINNEEYKKIQYSIEGLNQFLCKHHRNLLTKLKEGDGIVIGFSLLRHRSDFNFDMTAKCDSVAASTVEWKNSLYKGTGCRFSPRKKVSPTASTTSRSTLIGTQGRDTSKRQRRTCCIGWCRVTDTTMMIVPPFPPPIDDNASKNRQRTHHKKVFKPCHIFN